MPESDAADPEVRAWAEANCGWTSSFVDPFGEAPEPPECDILDAAVAAAAAGIDVDVADSDGSGDINLSGYWTKSCSYGNGAMSLSTISFTSIEQATQFFDANIGDGEFVDVDLGVAARVVARDGAATASSPSRCSRRRSRSRSGSTLTRSRRRRRWPPPRRPRGPARRTFPAESSEAP